MDGRAWIKNRILKPLYLNLVVFNMPQNPIYHIFNLNTGLEHDQRPAQRHVNDACISLNTIFIQNFPHVSSKPFNQPPLKVKPNVFSVKNGHQVRGFRLTSLLHHSGHAPSTTENSRKQQNYYFPRERESEFIQK